MNAQQIGYFIFIYFLQEPILEPISVRCDLKRAVGYTQVASSSVYRDLLLCEADVVMDVVTINLGQKDLATVLAVWSDNLSEGHYIGRAILYRYNLAKNYTRTP